MTAEKPARGLIIIPYVDCHAENVDAGHDALRQLAGDADVLLIDQGSTDPRVLTWQQNVVTAHPSRVRLWRHDPPLPSLAATWNAALDYAWACGHEDAMVWNNDIRVAPHMYASLRAVAAHHQLWFTTPVNAAASGDPEQWKLPPDVHLLTAPLAPGSLGGPDFSCFLIRRECHDKYRFDERFQPAYHEDGDYHRRQWLGGDGGKIAGVTLPYLHYGSRTIHRSEEAQRAFAPQFAACRARYVQKWGGEPHHERKITPDSSEDFDDVGTPGGYLSVLPPNITYMYPKNVVPMDEQGVRCVCGARGFDWSWGTRANGDVYNGCDFCTGRLNSEKDTGPGHRLDADNRYELCVDGVDVARG